VKVLIYPKSTNPYHELLYTPLRTAHAGDTFAYLAASPLNFLFFPFVVAAKRLQGYKVFHLHWHVFYIDPNRHIPFSKTLSFVNAFVCLSAVKLLGYRLVWTVHNVMPHEQHTSNDGFLMRYTARLAARLIVHSSSTVIQMQEMGIPTNKTTVIPIGTYGNLYVDNIDATGARTKLGITKGEFVILFFGLIRPYKGLDDLLRAFKAARIANARVVIAGQCQDDTLRAEIKRLSQGLRVDFYDQFIPNEDVAAYFRASDVVCLPFKQVTTSSSALLALSFGKPVVAPKIGALLDLPDTVGVFYDPAARAGLQNALTKAAASKQSFPAMSQAAVRYCKALSWDKIAAKTYQLYCEVLGRAKPGNASRPKTER
jgi:glycosyltransferase involved in cell wall biosynthesis